MPKDATPDEIVLVNDNFTNDNHEKIAEILAEEWGASTKFSKLGEENEIAHRATFQKVYNEYFGVPESLFGDGVEDKRTIKKIKGDHETYKDYRELRESGNLDPEEYRNVEFMDGFEPGEDELEYTRQEVVDMVQENYQKGYREGFQDGLEVSD